MNWSLVGYSPVPNGSLTVCELVPGRVQSSVQGVNRAVLTELSAVVVKALVLPCQILNTDISWSWKKSSTNFVVPSGSLAL